MMDPLSTLPVGSLAVIFFSRLGQDLAGYEETADRMLDLARQQDGFLGVDSLRDSSGLGVTVSYWRDRAAAAAWKRVAEHRLAQQQGSARWYSQWSLHICRVEESRCFGQADEERR